MTGIALNKSTTSIAVGSDETLTATLTPNNTSYTTVAWSSSDTSVATVNSSGKVTAVAAGTAVITATAERGGYHDSCTVTVTSA